MPSAMSLYRKGKVGHPDGTTAGQTLLLGISFAQGGEKTCEESEKLFSTRMQQRSLSPVEKVPAAFPHSLMIPSEIVAFCHGQL